MILNFQQAAQSEMLYSNLTQKFGPNNRDGGAQWANLGGQVEVEISTIKVARPVSLGARRQI